MGTLYIDTNGSATNSGSSDQNTADLSGSAATVSDTVVSLDGSPDLSGLSTTGANQAAIYINDATNSNRKIFWITAVDNDAKTVTVDVAPTGVTSSSWAIGGRHVLTNASIEGAVRAGDTVIFNNSPASQSGAMWTFRASGDATNGYIKLKGKDGTRPVLNTTGNTSCVSTSFNDFCWVENLEIDQDGASGNGITVAGNQCVTFNVKVSSAAGHGILITNSGNSVIGCEITGCGLNGINITEYTICFGNYIHDNTGSGIACTSPSVTILRNVIESNGGSGIAYTGSISAGAGSLAIIEGNTIYGNGEHGLTVTDDDSPIYLINNIFDTNGDGAGEYNVNWAKGDLQGFHAWNVFYQGGETAENLNGPTTNAYVANSEITTDPQLTDPGSGDFTLGDSSPAKAAGFPGQLLGGSEGYLDIGALQREEPSGSGSNGGFPLIGHGGPSA